MNVQLSLNHELYSTIQAGDVGQTRGLIQRGADVNCCPASGFTPLMFAALFGRIEVFSVLLEAGADPLLATDSQDNPHRTVLQVAVNNAQVKIVGLLLEHGVEVSPSDVHRARRLAERPFKQEQMREVVTLLQGKVTVT